MVCGAAGRFASAANLVSESPRFLVSQAEAGAIVHRMEAIVGSEWYPIARSCGVSDADCEAIRRAYLYPGFRT